MISSKRSLPFFLGLCVVCFLPVARAQLTNVTADQAVPIPGVGHDYIHLLSETVNPADGSVSARINIPMPKGRALTVPFAFAYDSNGVHFIQGGVGQTFWRTDTTGLSVGGWTYTIPRLHTVETNNGGTGINRCFYWTDYLFQDPQGGRHALRLSTLAATAGCTNAGPPAYTSGGDDTYAAMTPGPTSPSTSVVDRDGTVFQFCCLTAGGGINLASSIEDRNGNVVKITGNASAFSYADTLGRTVLNSGGFGATGNTVTVSGLSNPYTITWGTATSNFTVGSKDEHNLVCTFQGSDNETQSVIRAITLPNGKQYTFSYDSDNPFNTHPFGVLTQITYPSGAWVKYVWGFNPLSMELSFADTQNNPVGCDYLYDTPAITSRTVSFDGTHVALTQNFTYSTTWNSPGAGPSGWSSKQTTVTTTDQVRGGTFQAAYTYVPFYVASNDPDGYPYLGPALPLEKTTTYKDWNGTILKTVTKTWKDQFLLTDETVQLGTGSTAPTSDTHYTYYAKAQGFQLQEKDEYDFGPGAKGPLLRKTVLNYASFPATPIFSAGPSIFDRPSSIITYDGNNNRVGETDYAYDQSAVASVSNLPTGTHDETHYGASSTAPRGNATTMTKQCFPNCTNAVTTYTYDETGQDLTRKDPNGNTTNYSYADNFDSNPSSNTNAYLTQITDPPTNSISHIQKFKHAYSDGQLIQSTDENNQVSSYLYVDSLRRLTETDYPDGGQTTLSYIDTAPTPSVTTSRKMNSSGQLETSVGVMDGLGHVNQTQLTSDPDGTDFTDTAYDGLGRAFKQSNPHRSAASSTDGTTTYGYDALGRTTSVTLQDGSVTQTSYSGNTTTVTDPTGKSRKSASDGLGRLTQIVEDPGGLGYITNYTYDGLDNLTSVLQNGSRQRTFAYDSLSRLTNATNPESGSICYGTVSGGVCQANGYDANGNLITKTAPAPNQQGTATVTTTYFYDALNRLVGKIYSDSTPAVTFNYDQSSAFGVTLTNTIGRMSSQGTAGSAPTGSIFSYDPLGRIVNNSQCTPLNCGTTNFPITYTYDLAGDMTTYTNGANINGTNVTFTQTFDAAARVTQLSSNFVDVNHPATLATVDSGMGYYPSGALRKVTYGNGLTATWAFNNRLQPCRYNTNSSGTALGKCADAIPSGSVQDFNLGFSAGVADNGNVASMIANGAQTFNRTYTYDQLNRLSKMTDSVTTQPCQGLQWTYDAWGNRTDQTVTAGTCNTFHATANTQNQLVDPVNHVYQYDAAGNLTADGNHTYTYDAENRLTKVDGGSTATYVYGPYGRRARKTAQYNHDDVYDLAGNVIAEWVPCGSSPCWGVGYVYANGSLLAEYEYNQTYFAHKDHLGSTRLLTGLNQSIVQDLDYLPFGELTSSGTAITTHEFTGKERDNESGLDNFGARYDSSSMGRFMSPDPVFISAQRLTDPQSLNLYSYVRNNPLSLTDPDGLDFYLACQTSDHSGCGQVQNGSDKVWVQGQTVDGKFQATDIDMNKAGDASAGYHDQFGNQYTGTFDQNNGVSFTNTATGDTSGHSRFIDGSDTTNVSGSGAFSNITGNFFSDCGGSCEARGSLTGSQSAFDAMTSALNKQSSFMTALDRRSGAHPNGAQWKDAHGYVHVINQNGRFEMHFEGHPTGVDVTNFVLHMVDTIRDAASGRAREEKNATLP